MPTFGYEDKDVTFRPSIDVIYQIRALNSDELLFETTVEVPKGDVVKKDGPEVQRWYDAPEWSSEAHDNFKLESSISATLMEVTVGTQLLKLAVSVEAAGLRFQSTNHPLQVLRDNSGFKRESSPLWRLFLSPGAEFLLLLRNANSLDRRAIDVDIFQDINHRRNPTKPLFKWVASKSLEVCHQLCLTFGS